MEYDYLNRLTAVTNTEGEKQCYYYNCLGRMTGTTDALGNKTEYAYTPTGKLAMVRDAAGNETKYSYDCMGRLTAMSHIKEGFTEAYTYEYDAAGNRLKTTKTSVRDGISDSSIYEYGYDELYHLTGVKRNGDILRRYEYDSYGNRT